MHTGVDSEAKGFHSLETTAPNVYDSKVIGELFPGEEKAVWGSSAYMGKADVIKLQALEAIDHTHKRGTRNEEARREKISFRGRESE